MLPPPSRRIQWRPGFDFPVTTSWNSHFQLHPAKGPSKWNVSHIQSSGCVDDIRWRAQIKCRAQSERAWLAVNGEFNHAVISRVQVWLRNAAVTHRLHQVHHSWAYSPNTHNRTRHMHMPVAFYVPTLLFFFFFTSILFFKHQSLRPAVIHSCKSRKLIIFTSMEYWGAATGPLQRFRPSTSLMVQQ